MEIKQLCFQVFALQCLPHYDYKAKDVFYKLCSPSTTSSIIAKVFYSINGNWLWLPGNEYKNVLEQDQIGSDQNHPLCLQWLGIYIYIQKFTVTAKTCSRGFFLLLQATIVIYHHLTLQQWGFPCCNFSQRHIICLGDW